MKNRNGAAAECSGSSFNLPELLAPAGSMEAFQAAVNAGADAVYLAGSRFGARAYADNFSDEELLEVLKEAHLCGVRINLTVNTLTREKELPDILKFLEPLCAAGLDGVIVQDIGVISSIHRNFPGLAVHASTQISVTGPEAVRYYAALGVTRVVPARELSLQEIKDLKSELPMEVETFIHGAMCYCYSGKCLLSGFLGGRSGNRGRCAQPCRLPYHILDGGGKAVGPDARRAEVYPLSMRDMCTLEILPELIEAGIDSFKIEGRMKKPEYAAGVTNVYRRSIDRYAALRNRGREAEWQADPADLAMLQDLYLRTERSQGYYHQRNGRAMVTVEKPGYSGADENRLAAVHDAFVKPIRRIPVRGRAVLIPGKEAEFSLTVCDAGGKTGSPDPAVQVTVRGALVQNAQKQPLTDETVRKNLTRLGDTVFTAEERDMEVTFGGAAFLPVSLLNELRRNAVSVLEKELLDRYNRQSEFSLRQKRYALEQALQFSGERDFRRDSAAAGCVFTHRTGSLQKPAESENSRPAVWASAITREQAAAAADAGADLLIDDSGCFALEETGRLLAFPPVIRNTDRIWLETALEKMQKGNYGGALVREAEALEFLRSRGYRGFIASDQSFYCWNADAMRVLQRDCDGIVCPLELNGGELRELFSEQIPYILTVYGRLPMMITAGCIRRTENICTGREEGFFFLQDRMNGKFPVRTLCSHCSNILYNSVPLSLHQFGADALVRKSGALLLAFTTENADETHRITDTFRGMAENGTAAAPVREFTNGHYRKGVQ